MMMLLGQHGQPQDYQMGLEHIHLAAESCDGNAPQGAYVRSDPYTICLECQKSNYFSPTGLWYALGARTDTGERSRAVPSP